MTGKSQSIQHLNQQQQMISLIKFLNSKGLLLTRHLSRTSTFDFSKTKRVRDLSEVKIQLPGAPAQEKVAEQIDYLKMRDQLKQLNWEHMQFDKLCALPEQTLVLLNMEIKKDKFNVDDSQFYDFSLKELHLKLQNNTIMLEKLNSYYRRMYYLLTNQLQQYDDLAKVDYQHNYYKAEMYIMDLISSTKLKNAIEYFVNNIQHPKKLEIVAEPSFIKSLLTLKRELMMQGVHFETLKDQKLKRKHIRRKIKAEKQKSRKEEEQSEQSDVFQDNSQDQLNDQFIDKLEESKQTGSRIDQFIIQQLKQSKHKIKILKVLGYQYEFWVDVKHNRSKNGVEDDYIIEDREIDNPNQSILVKQKYPKIKVRYIVHKKKRKTYSMHFCIKASLQIDVSGSSKNIKVEWRGPSSNHKENEQDMSFMIIDYEHLMNGNPTIKPVFYF